MRFIINGNAEFGNPVVEVKVQERIEHNALMRTASYTPVKSKTIIGVDGKLFVYETDKFGNKGELKEWKHSMTG